MIRLRMGILVALLALACLTPLAFSQTITTADAVGVVSDSTGAVVPGATVALKSIESGETRTATSNERGEYRFPLLKPGEYSVTATAKGLKSSVNRVRLLVGQEQTVNLTMAPEGTSTVVEVTTEAPIVQTENANLETSYNNKQVQDLPMAGGDLTTLAMTVPGVRVNVAGGSSNLNANGIMGASVLYTLNGMDENDPANNINNSGASNNLLGTNEVGEAAVVLNAYSPQYGRMAGAQVNLVGISGTNQFHGNVFYNYNWQDLNANSFFNNSSGTPRGRSDAHNFGGRFGGPILKNKLFAFFDDENLRYVLPAAGIVSLPSPQLAQYTLAHVSAASLPLYNDYFALVNGSPGINRAVGVQNGSGQLQDGNGVLGCGTGTFAGTMFSPTQSFGKSVGAANGGATTAIPCAIAFGINDTEINTEQLYTIRADYNINNSQKIFFRFNHDFGVQATGTSPINPAYNAISVQPQYQGGINHTWVVTPTLVNNFIGSVIWYSALFGVQDFTKTTSLMPEAINVGDGGANGGGFATVGGATYPNGFPVGRNVGHIQLNDDIAWTKGVHAIKAGFAYRRDRYTYSQIAQSAFIGQYNLNDLADFANGKLNFTPSAGLGSSFSQSFTPFGALHFRVPSIDFYASDEWAVKKNLKLTFGLRFEDNFNPSCVETCFSLTNVPFVSSTYQGGVSVPYNSTIQTHSNMFYNSEGVITEPRVGVAWTPFGSGKTVIRGGIGLFSTNYSDGITGTFAGQIPNRFTPSGLTFGNIGLANDQTSSAFSAAQSASGFFTGFTAGDTLAQIRSAIAPVAFSTPSFTSSPSTFRAPKDIEWSFEIQQQINAHNLFVVSYVGNHGYDLAETENANMFTSAAGVSRYHGGFSGLPTAAPDGRFVSVTQYFNIGISNYDALTIQYRHTFSYGLTGQIHYTWSHALGDTSTSTTNSFFNPLNINASYGNLGFDNRHQLSGDVLWNQPFKAENHIVNSFIQGWTVGLKMYLYSGSPFSVTDSKIPAQINSAGGVVTPLADLLTSSALGANCGGVAVNAPCLSKTQFATYSTTSGVSGVPVQADWGNTSPNQFFGPGYFDIDGQITREFRIKERMSFALGMQAYNVLNHTNFANPSGSISSGAFGTITSTLGPPTSIYGTGQGASVSGRVALLTGRFTF